MKTTKEEIDKESHNDLVKNLQELLEKNYDAEKGFTKAMTDAKNPSLKSFLQRQAAQRSRFANELTDEIINLNEKPIESGSATGTLHRAWIDIKTSLSGDKDEAVLEECIRGEKASVDEYHDRLKNYDFPLNISNVLTKQADDINATLSKVKTLEDIA